MKKILVLFLALASLQITAYAFKPDSIEAKVGQTIIVGFNGDSVESPGFKKVLRQLKKGEISGIIIFKKNIKSKDELTKMIAKAKSVSKITPIISIDNEGGYVQRYDFEQYPSARAITNLDMNDVIKEYSKMAKLESELGINLNFAPVVDLEINENSIIAKKERSFSHNPRVVSEYAKIFINEHTKRNIATSIKHFPGHGSVMGDTHLGFVDSTNTFQDYELEPYRSLRAISPINTVMVSHIFNSNFDNVYPASLSERTINMLRNDIGFEGVIVSDDYDMGAIRKRYCLKNIITLYINSGIDLAIFSNNLGYYDANIPKKIRKIVKKGIASGEIDPMKLDNAYNKVLRFKKNLK